MAFVTEKIPDADRSMNDKEALGKLALFPSIRPRVDWTIDRVRNAYFVMLSGGLGEIPERYALVWNREIITFEARSRVGRDDKRPGGLSMNWNVQKIYCPRGLLSRQGEILQLIRDAIDAYGWLGDRTNIENISVETAPECWQVQDIKNNGSISRVK